jgi:hypothetical protein
MVPANRVDASGRKGGGNAVVSATLKADVTGGKNSNRCGNETQENICLSKVEEGKRKGSAVYD